jgi:SulP family sulfate permease
MAQRVAGVVGAVGHAPVAVPDRTTGYGVASFRKDVLAGATVAAISLPQAMAYALIAGVNPRFGLYSAIVVTAIASVFGSSSHLVNGPTNAISLVVFSALAFIDPEARLDAFEAMFLLGIMVGSVQIAIAVAKLGDLTRYISEAVVLGFMAGAGFLVALGQVSNLLGVADKGSGHQAVIHRLWLTLSASRGVNPRSLAVGLATIVLVIVARRVLTRLAWPRVDMLVTLVATAAVCVALGWTRAGADGKTLVAVIGSVPSGLPSPHIPVIQFAWVRELGGSAVAIGILGLLEALAIAKSIANETGETLDYNRQCLAEGLANLGGGFFQCLPGSGSLTRSAINYQAGAVTRASGLIAAAAVAAVVAILAPLARFVPKPALAGLLMVTAWRLIDRRRLAYALRASRFDAALVVTTAVSAVFVSVEFSILIGVALSILLFVPRAARLKATELVVSAERVVRVRQKDEAACRWVTVYDFEGELFFGAATELERYFDELRARVRSGARVVVLRLRRTRNPDLVCLERLEHFVRGLQAEGVTVLLTGIGADCAAAMRNLRFGDWLPGDRVFSRDPSAPGSSTVDALREAYRTLGSSTVHSCPHCVSLGSSPADGDLRYVV